MKRKLNLIIEEVKINKNLQSKGMYGGACGGACGGGAPCASSVDSGDPTSNGFGGTAAGGSVGEGGGWLDELSPEEDHYWSREVPNYNCDRALGNLNQEPNCSFQMAPGTHMYNSL